MQQVLFNGKVRVQPLVIADPSAPRTEVLARLKSPGGELAVLTDGSWSIRHLSYVELIPGKIRGNHYHRLRHETFYVISGEIELHLKDLATGGQTNVALRAGDLVQIAPEIVHTFLPQTPGHALEFAPQPFDATDVFRVPFL